VTISRDDIEAKARQIVSAIDETRESAKNTAVLAGVAIAVVVVIAFVMGRRRGRRSKTLVEVYRV
jgi:ABC-type dipeptide/oligopeptide/nickel transport system permease component